MSIVGIKAEKLAALLDEGFSKEYLIEIMQFKPCPTNPNFDLNSLIRGQLGIDSDGARAAVSMTNWDISPVALPRNLSHINPIGKKR